MSPQAQSEFVGYVALENYSYESTWVEKGLKGSFAIVFGFLGANVGALGFVASPYVGVPTTALGIGLGTRCGLATGSKLGRVSSAASERKKHKKLIKKASKRLNTKNLAKIVSVRRDALNRTQSFFLLNTHQNAYYQCSERENLNKALEDIRSYFSRELVMLDGVLSSEDDEQTLELCESHMNATFCELIFMIFRLDMTSKSIGFCSDEHKSEDEDVSYAGLSNY